jgi:hypothetical protein
MKFFVTKILKHPMLLMLLIIIIIIIIIQSSSICIATGYGPNGQDSISGRERLSFLLNVQVNSMAHPAPVQRIPGAVSLGGKVSRALS